MYLMNKTNVLISQLKLNNSEENVYFCDFRIYRLNSTGLS